MGLNQWMDNRADDAQSTGEQSAPRHGRAALLRLATWFEEAGPERADALATAAYTLHPALHLEGRVDEGIAATTSWWQAAPDRSTVTEHPGTRLPEPVRDHRAQQARLRDAAESSAHWRRAGAAQIRSLLAEPTGHRARLDLSGAGMEVLMELLTAALGSGDASRRPTSAGDLEFALRLHIMVAPGAEVIIQGEGGELTLEGLRLRVTPYEQHTVEEDGEGGENGFPTLPATGTPTAGTPVTGISQGNTPVVAASGAESARTAVPKTTNGDNGRSEPPGGDDGSRTTREPFTQAGVVDLPAPVAQASPAQQKEPLAPDSPADPPPAADIADSGERGHGPEDPPGAPVEGTESTGNLPGPDPDVETTGPIDLSADRPWTQTWG